MAEDDFVAKTKGAHPFPWKKTVYPNGSVIITDAKGKDIPLFVLVDFICSLTEVMSRPRKEAA